MEYVKLGDLCNESSGLIAAVPDEIIDYVDISSVDNAAKRVTGYESIRYADAPSRARRQAEKGCIIVSTVRPNLNAVAMCDFDVPHRLVVSTGFCVLSCKAEVDPDYVFLFCQSPKFIETLVKQATGASYPAVNDTIIRSVMLPAYSYAEQTEIASRLKALKKIIESRQRQLRTLDTLIKARFVEMFGDPVANPKGWEKRALSDEAEIRIGPFGSLLHKEDYITGGHALINPSHIVDGKISPDTDLTLTDEKYEELAPYHLIEGDVVMGRRGEMGRCAVVDRPGLLCGTGSLLIRTKGDLSADYIQKLISFPSFKRTIEDMAVGQTMPNLNVPIVSAFQIIKPPKAVQEQYYAFVSQVDKSKAAVQAALDKTQVLFDSLMQEYFG